jgi:hypothetical protein
LGRFDIRSEAGRWKSVKWREPAASFLSRWPQAFASTTSVIGKPAAAATGGSSGSQRVSYTISTRISQRHEPAGGSSTRRRRRRRPQRWLTQSHAPTKKGELKKKKEEARKKERKIRSLLTSRVFKSAQQLLRKVKWDCRKSSSQKRTFMCIRKYFPGEMEQ